MLSQLHDFRKKSNATLWRVLLSLWIVSVINIIIATSFSISQKDKTILTAIHSNHAEDSSLIEFILNYLLKGVNPNADLTDVEDSIDKIEFVSTHDSNLRIVNSGERISPPAPHRALLNIFLEKSTPPPKLV